MQHTITWLKRWSTSPTCNRKPPQTADWLYHAWQQCRYTAQARKYLHWMWFLLRWRTSENNQSQIRCGYLQGADSMQIAIPVCQFTYWSRSLADALILSNNYHTIRLGANFQAWPYKWFEASDFLNLRQKGTGMFSR